MSISNETPSSDYCFARRHREERDRTAKTSPCEDLPMLSRWFVFSGLRIAIMGRSMRSFGQGLAWLNLSRKTFQPHLTWTIQKRKVLQTIFRSWAVQECPFAEIARVRRDSPALSFVVQIFLHSQHTCLIFRSGKSRIASR